MPTSLTDRPVHEFVTSDPRAAQVFDRLGIDYCCQGGDSLRESCERSNLDCDRVLRELRSVELQPQEPSLEGLDLAKLADHIVAVHHTYLRRELPALTEKLAKVVAAHGDRDPRLAELAHLFADFRCDLEAHMLEEEEIVFPYCRSLVTGSLSSLETESVEQPVADMLADHQEAGDAIAMMRTLTDGFTPPESACPTYRSLLWQLVELERDLHRHVHKENYLLFPQAIELEAERAG